MIVNDTTRGVSKLWCQSKYAVMIVIDDSRIVIMFIVKATEIMIYRAINLRSQQFLQYRSLQLQSLKQQFTIVKIFIVHLIVFISAQKENDKIQYQSIESSAPSKKSSQRNPIIQVSMLQNVWSLSMTLWTNKLECLSLTSFFNSECI